MNLLSRRVVRRAGTGAVALFAAAAVAGIGSPAYAKDAVDLAVEVAGTTIAANASGKFGVVKLTNNGEGVVAAVDVEFDISDLDTSKVALALPPECDRDGDKIVCGLLEDFVPPPGGTTEVDFPMERKPGASGDAGTLTITATHAGTDPDMSNNTRKVNVSVGASGVDLRVIAFDVYALDADGNVTDKPVPPGDTSVVWVYVENQGDQPAAGVKLAVKLPEHVTFAVAEHECTHEVGDTETTCEYNIPLVPVDDDESDADEVYSYGWFYWPVTVADDAPTPSTLDGGTAAVEAAAPILMAQSAAKVPANFTAEAPSPTLKDVDPSDNIDDFVVFVGKEGAGGSLPITGVQAGLIGAAGAAVVVAGVVLLLLARRRRVVTVVPGDGSSE